MISSYKTLAGGQDVELPEDMIMGYTTSTYRCSSEEEFKELKPGDRFGFRQDNVEFEIVDIKGEDFHYHNLDADGNARSQLYREPVFNKAFIDKYGIWVARDSFTCVHCNEEFHDQLDYLCKKCR